MRNIYDRPDTGEFLRSVGYVARELSMQSRNGPTRWAIYLRGIHFRSRNAKQNSGSSQDFTNLFSRAWMARQLKTNAGDVDWEIDISGGTRLAAGCGRFHNSGQVTTERGDHKQYPGDIEQSLKRNASGLSQRKRGFATVHLGRPSQ